MAVVFLLLMRISIVLFKGDHFKRGERGLCRMQSMEPRELCDEDLVARIVDGSEEEFNILYNLWVTNSNLCLKSRDSTGLLRRSFCPTLPGHERRVHPPRTPADHDREAPPAWRRKGRGRGERSAEGTTAGAQTVSPAPSSVELIRANSRGRPSVRGCSSCQWLRNRQFALHRNLAGPQR
jgi:hypothetical protein